MILPSDVSVKLISQSKNRGLLEVSPLPTGFGHTLGNSLRRILLSQIKGAAVTQVKIKGVSHKFSNVPGVKQDVLELTLRLKQIRLKIFGDQTVVLQISKQGPGEVTAADIKTGGDCEVINKDLVIADLSDKNVKLEMEILASPGYGYTMCDGQESDKLGVIVLDSIYSPVFSVSYEVNTARVGQQTNLDKLTLDITTDGSISPQQAFVHAATILGDYFDRLKMGQVVKALPDQDAVVENEEDILSAKDKDIPVDDLNLPIRIINSLKKGGIETLGDLSKTSEETLRKIRNVGGKSLEKIKKTLESEGFVS
ncbi:DNA-directed RNA polymerase subunit alpha [candidate division WWE3 bacterium CG08_land_8_20_14_0_20_43_13]|uniref:DNA-directed RNA polymerase subunit alpha n=1 Tax=candidate division WWE3 bacterium CG08_land_8_20_14_0_20_43_13 TaxID=1975087 RepID=A0A2H0X777_UNCKA|nr:MAG: DNA-directed RNA polymerase subunit alpha [candidate division WWE3 bacterium CG08_land_8_20_14_0_20_43_13]